MSRHDPLRAGARAARAESDDDVDAAEQEAAAIQDPQERLDFLNERPDREDVRMVVGVLRTGESWCAVRSRSRDSSDQVMNGEALVPGLVEALSSTLV